MMLAKGMVVYRDVYESKPPLFHAINWLNYLLVGNNVHFARILIMVISSLTSLVIFDVTRKMVGDSVGVVAGILFALLSSSPWLGGFKVMTEPYSTLFCWLSLSFLYREKKEGFPLHSFISGIFIGCYIFIRFTGILFFFFLISWILVFEKESRYRHKLLFFIFGASVVPAAFSLYFLVIGAFPEMLFWLLEPAHGFKEVVTVNIFGKLFWFKDVFVATLPVWLLASFSFFDMKNKFIKFLLSWGTLLVSFFIFSFLPAFPHYYYEVLPVLCVLSAIPAAPLLNVFQNTLERNYDVRQVKYFVVVALLLVVSLMMSFGKNVELSVEYGGYDDLSVVSEVSDYLCNRVEPRERILVFENGWPKIGPYVYFFTGTFPPLENLFFFPWDMTVFQVDDLIVHMEDEGVRYVVFIGPSDFYLESDGLREYVVEKYVLDHYISGVFDVYPHLSDEVAVSIFLLSE